MDRISGTFDQTWINSFESVQASVYRMLSDVHKIVSVSETSSLFFLSFFQACLVTNINTDTLPWVFFFF